MYCSKCGNQNPIDAKFCNVCGASFKTSASFQNEIFQVHEKKEEPLNVAYMILALIIPIVGIIQYIVWKKEQPKKANSILPWAIVGAVINFIYFYS